MSFLFEECKYVYSGVTLDDVTAAHGAIGRQTVSIEGNLSVSQFSTAVRAEQNHANRVNRFNRPIQAARVR